MNWAIRSCHYQAFDIWYIILLYPASEEIFPEIFSHSSLWMKFLLFLIMMRMSMNVLLLGPLHPFWSAFADPDLPPTSNCPFLVMLMMILARKIFEKSYSIHQHVIFTISSSPNHYGVRCIWGFGLLLCNLDPSHLFIFALWWSASL